METGIIMVGPRAGQRTECNSGEHTCLVHKKGSHREMSPKNLDRFNRSVAARNKTSNQGNDPGTHDDESNGKAVNGAIPSTGEPSSIIDVAHLANKLDQAPVMTPRTAAELQNSRRAYDKAVDIVLHSRGVYHGQRALNRLVKQNESTKRQTTHLFTTNHGDWLTDQEIGPLAVMPGDEVQLTSADGTTITIQLQAGFVAGELTDDNGNPIFKNGQLVKPNCEFVRISSLNGYRYSTINDPSSPRLPWKPHKSFPAGAEMYAQVPGSSKSGIVMIDGNGGAIDETTKELHRICDLKSLNIIQWRYPASYEDRQLQIEENMKRMAFPEYIADITRENENRTVAWESRSRARKLIDNARHNELTLIPLPSEQHIQELSPELLLVFASNHPQLTERIGNLNTHRNKSPMKKVSR